MSARDSIKGYLYQTLIALLKMLDDDTWANVTIEPKELDEKVDIYCVGKQSKAIQVKSSKSRVNKSDAVAFIQDLRTNCPNADHYELILCAHVTDELKNGNVLEGATLVINNSPPLDLTQQAAHRLDVFLTRHAISQTPPLVRELLTRALISRLVDYSTTGDSVARSEFEDLIKTWVLSCYPEAIRQSRFSTCEITHGPCEMQLTTLKDPNTGLQSTKEELVFVSDLYFVNASHAPSIIQYVVYSLTVDDQRHFFLPRFFFDPTKIDHSNPPGEAAGHQKGLQLFQPICVVSKGIESRKLVAFSLRSEVSSDFLRAHSDSSFVLEVFVKYQHVDSYILAHAFNPNILFDELFTTKKSIGYLLPDIEQDIEALNQPPPGARAFSG